jgi:hypothetical protein
MSKNSLETFIENIKATWGPLTSEMVAECMRHVSDLAKASASEEWLSALQRNLPEHEELYRDPSHGFLLLAHAEAVGRYRPPHNHGRGWVIYAVQGGEMEVGTYVRLTDEDGKVSLVKRETYSVRPGEVRVYLPGDIHDTRCTAGPVLLYRFTSRDLIEEEKVAHKLTRYVEKGGAWAERVA